MPRQSRRLESPVNVAVKSEISLPEPPAPAKRRLTPGILDLPTTLLRAYPLILIVAVAWFANFLHFTSFGYYEDDWYYFPSAFSQSFSSRIQVVLPMIKS